MKILTVICMETKELFAKVISKKEWYKPLVIMPQTASTYKKRFFEGTLREEAMAKMLEKLGYEKKVVWKKKK